MMYLDHDEKARAVLFFGSEGIARELLYGEFEALLDGFVPLEEWSGRTLKGVYVEFNSQFLVTSAVFFLVSFEDSGLVEAAWNMPLTDLARTSAKGPDMGAGPIHIACKSKCPIAMYKDSMWEPVNKDKASHFAAIAKAVKRNRLGFVFKQVDEDTTAGANQVMMSSAADLQYQKELKRQMESLLKEQRQQMASFSSDKENALKEVRLEYIAKIEQLQAKLQDAESNLRDAEKRNEELKETIDGQVQKIEGLREYFEHKLERAQGNEQEIVDSLKAHYEAESDAKLNSVTKEMSELLKMKEVELVYRIEHEEQLRDEIEAMRRSNQELIENSGNHLLSKLSEKGVNFVTYQPGAGHITIPLDEIANFIDNPTEFTAAYCGVSERHYQAWLRHYQAPVCAALVDDEHTCSANIERVTTPSQFVPGESEFCQEHQGNSHIKAGSSSVAR